MNERSVLALAAIVLMVVLATAVLASAEGDDGDWVLSQDTTIAGEELLLSGDLRVEAGSTLTVVRSTILFQGDGGHALVVEEGARLVLEGSTLGAVSGSAYTFEVWGEAWIEGCDISGATGGIQAFADGLFVGQSRIHGCRGPAIEFHGHDGTVTGCTIFDVEVGISSVDIGEGPGDVEADLVDGWSYSLSDTTITAKAYGVYLYWKKSLSGTLDLDFATTLSGVTISRCTNAGIYCYVDLYVNKGSGALDELFDLKMTGGSSKDNGGPGLYVYHYIKPYYLNANVVSENRIDIQGAELSSNGGDGILLEDTLYQDRGNGASITHKQSLKLTDCKVNSNSKSGICVKRPRTIYYVYGTGQKSRTTGVHLIDTEVKGNTEWGVYLDDNHYAYSTRGKFVWYNYLTLAGATVESNNKDGIYSYLYDRTYYGDRSGVDYRQYFDFQDSVIGKNGEYGFEITTSGYMYYHGTMGFRNDLKVLRCRIHNNTGMGGYAYFYIYGYDYQYTFSRTGAYTFSDNLVADNQGGGVHARTYGYSYKQTTDVTLRCTGNVVKDNGADRALGFEGMSGNKGEALVEGNVFEGNGGPGGTTCLDLVYFTQFVVAGNTFRDGSHRTVVRCYANGMGTPSPNLGKYNDWVQVYENTFEGSGTGTANTDGAVVIDTASGNGALRVQDNTMRDLEGNGVTAYRSQGKGTLTVSNNVFDGLGGSGVRVSNSYSGARTVVTGNTMVNGTGPPQSAVVLISDDGGSTITVTGNDASLSTCAGVVSTGSSGPRALTVRDNRLVGLGGNAIDLVGTSFTVEDNNLSDCKGFAIALRGFTQLPSVGANIIERAENGLYLEAKERTDGIRLKIHMDNVTWEVNETAIQTKHLDLVVTNSTLKGRRALSATDGSITAISTSVPYLGGTTGPEGVVEVYFMVGIDLIWANATGVDSGLPANDALVVFRKSTGGYHTSRIADGHGRLPPELIPSWRMTEGHPDRISPYDLEITASGLVTHATLRVEEDHQARVLVVDWAKPFISVEKPYDGARVNTADLTVKGFLQERGSGLDGAWVSLDGQEWTPVEPEQIWEAHFKGLQHGPARIYAKARDRSGNINITDVHFELDLLGPSLEVLRPLNGTRTREREVIVEATTEKTAELFLDGVPVQNRQGQLFERYQLSQGLNIIVVESVDGSGNAAIEVLHIWHDTVEPALFVTSPKEGELAPHPLIVVSGRTETQAEVAVNDIPATVDAGGWFSLEYVLTSRQNLLAIEATDLAGNVNVTYRRVTLDDQPPVFSIITPPDGLLTSSTEVLVEGSVGQDDLDATIYVDGQRLEHLGRFTHTVTLEEGENRIEVRAVDPNGRESVTTVRVVRDTVPPVISLTSPAAREMTTREGILAFTGVAETATYLTINSHHYDISSDGSFDFGYELEAGVNLLEVEVRDEAGNPDIVMLTIEWDSSPPDLRLDPLPPRVRDETIMLNGTTEGAIVTVDGVPVPISDGMFSVPLHLAMGHNTFEVVAYDAAGNEASHQVQIDREERLGEMKASTWEVPILTILPLVAAVIALAATVVLTRGRPRPLPPPRRKDRPRSQASGTDPEPVVVDLPVEAPRPEAPAAPDPREAEAVYDPTPQGLGPDHPLVMDDPEPPVWEPPGLPPADVTPHIPVEEPVPREPQMEFASLPMYSVPDPTTVNGEVHVDANGDISLLLDTRATARRRPEQAPRPEPQAATSPGPRPEPRPEPRPAPRPEPRSAPRPAPRPEPRPRPGRQPLPRPRPAQAVSPAPKPRPAPVPRPAEKPRPAPVPRPSRPSAPVPVKSPVRMAGKDPLDSPSRAPAEHPSGAIEPVLTKSSSVVDVVPTGQVTVDVDPSSQEIREAETPEQRPAAREPLEEGPAGTSSTNGGDSTRPPDRRRFFINNGGDQPVVESEGAEADGDPPLEDARTARTSREIEDLLNDLDILSDDE